MRMRRSATCSSREHRAQMASPSCDAVDGAVQVLLEYQGSRRQLTFSPKGDPLCAVVSRAMEALLGSPATVSPCGVEGDFLLQKWSLK